MMQPRHAITALLLSLLSLHAGASLQASLDRDQVSLGDSLQLTIQQDGSRSGSPDLSPLKADFDVLGTSQGSSIQIVNGRMSQQAQLQITLSPKHDGKLTIPPLTWGSERTSPLSVNVGGSSGNPAPSGSSRATPGSNVTDRNADSNVANSTSGHVFLDTSLSQTEPYVQNAVVLTVRVYGDSMLAQAGLNLAASTDVLVQQLGQDAQHRESRGGRDYQVIERRYLLTPQRSGKLTLDGPILDAQIAELNQDDSMFGGSPFGNVVSTHPIRLRGKPVQLDVRPRPVDRTGHALLPAQSVTFSDSWQPDKQQISTGEPLTRHLHLSAVGVPSNGLPDLSQLLVLPEGIKAYPDQPKLASQMQGDNLVASADLDIALIANRPGHYVLPALTLSWWDTTQNKQRDITLPARTLDVSGAVISAPSSVTIQPNHAPASSPATSAASPAGWPWRGISMALGGLWLLTLLAWLWDHRRLARRTPTSPPQTGDSERIKPDVSLKAFQAACHAHDATAARQHLVAWAHQTWPDQPPSGMGQLAERLASPDLAPLLAELDRACYGQDANPAQWDGSRLAALIKPPSPDSKKPKASFGLEELYPR